MNYELNEFEAIDNNDLVKHQDSVAEGVDDSLTDRLPAMSHASLNPGIFSHGVYKVQEIPAVKELVNECKESFTDGIVKSKDKVNEFFETLGENIRLFSEGIYDNVSSYLKDTGKAFKDIAKKLTKEFKETREFGIDKCVEAAEEIFNPVVISRWMHFNELQRRGICTVYAGEVAKAFELRNYNGLVFEKMKEDSLGYNMGDGYMHLSEDLLDPMVSPMSLIDTITHELRHQYQSESMQGMHDVTEKVRTEWIVADSIYSEDNAWCYDPWGYYYNPLEIDSRYAGNTVVRDLTSKLFNDVAASL